MADFFTSNPAYLEYVKARWQRDMVRATELVRTGLESGDPLERAHWLVVHAGLLIELPSIPGHRTQAWDCLAEALCAASDLYELRRAIFMVMIAFVTYDGLVQPCRSLLQRLQPDLRRLVREPRIAYNIGAVRFFSGHWRQAALWYNRAFAAGYVSSGGPAGQAVAFAARARVYARLGRLREAEADLAEAGRLFDRHGQGRPRHGSLTLAAAELALLNGRLQEARSIIQQFLVEPDATAPINIAEFHLLAAELALAEGNAEGYRHYCELAQADCREYGLNLFTRFVHAVMAESERRYGAPR